MQTLGQTEREEKETESASFPQLCRVLYPLVEEQRRRTARTRAREKSRRVILREDENVKKNRCITNIYETGELEKSRDVLDAKTTLSPPGALSIYYSRHRLRPRP